jgi:hypothetical protein
MHVFSGGRREQEAALLENPVVAAYLGFLQQIDEEAVPKCIEAFAYAVKQHIRIHPADDLAGHFAEIGVLDRLESLSQSAQIAIAEFAQDLIGCLTDSHRQ